MKEMIKRVREEKGGFTLAELLIVVAIILILVAIAVPVFTGAQESARQATHDANIRNAKSTVMVYSLKNDVKTTAAAPVIKGTGNVAEDGSISIDSVTAVADAEANKDQLGAENGNDTTGAFTVYLTPTDLEMTE